MEALIENLAGHFDEYAGMTNVLVPQSVHAAAEHVADLASFPADQVKYLLGMFAAYPLGLISTFLPSATLKHAFSLAVGIFIAQFVFGNQWIHSLISSAFVYFLLLATANIKALDNYRHHLVFLFMMGYMSMSHIYRIYVDYMGWSLDFTGPQMLLTIKLTALAWNLYDGSVGADALAKKVESADARSRKVYEGMQHRSIAKLPSFLEYFGYVFNYSSFLAGPAFGISEYLAVANGSAFKSEQGKMPGRAWPAFVITIQALVCLVAMIVGTAKFPLTVLFDADSLASAKSSIPGFLRHIALAWVALFFVRCKYYFAWLLSEAGAITAGYGFEGRDKEGKPQWRGARNIDVWGFEAAQSVSAGSRAWNQRTQVWLERYVYHRTNRSLAKVYFVSAFWHGFYPGYYLFFLSVPLATEVSRIARRRIRPLFLEADGKTPKSNKFIYDLLTWAATTLTMNYLATVFQVLSWERSILTWSGFYFCGHIIFVICYLVFPRIFRAPKKPDAAKKTQ